MPTKLEDVSSLSALLSLALMHRVRFHFCLESFDCVVQMRHTCMTVGVNFRACTCLLCSFVVRLG